VVARLAFPQLFTARRFRKQEHPGFLYAQKNICACVCLRLHLCNRAHSLCKLSSSLRKFLCGLVSELHKINGNSALHFDRTAHLDKERSAIERAERTFFLWERGRRAVSFVANILQPPRKSAVRMTFRPALMGYIYPKSRNFYPPLFRHTHPIKVQDIFFTGSLVSVSFFQNPVQNHPKIKPKHPPRALIFQLGIDVAVRAQNGSNSLFFDPPVFLPSPVFWPAFFGHVRQLRHQSDLATEIEFAQMAINLRKR